MARRSGNDPARRKARRAAPRRAADAPLAGAVRESAGATGYANVLGVRALDASELHGTVLEGFAFAALKRLQEKLALTADELGELLMIAPRTLARRKREGRLHAEESDRLLRAARIFGAAIDLFDGDEGAARRWLATKHAALGGERPLDVARTDVGARAIEALIGRLEHGIVS